MKRDSIFYRLFQQSPSLLFDLLETPPDNASAYRFDSVAVKEPKFEIDGVFLPPDSDNSGIVFFCEVQFQKDERLYERLFSEIFLYFYRNRERYADWQAVVIYPEGIIFGFFALLIPNTAITSASFADLFAALLVLLTLPAVERTGILGSQTDLN